MSFIGAWMLKLRSTSDLVTDNIGEIIVRGVPSNRRYRRDWIEVRNDVARRIDSMLCISRW